MSINKQEPNMSNADIIEIRTKHSLIHLGSIDSFDITDNGKSAADKIIDYLKSGNKDSLKKAIKIYERIIPNENFGGEYTALNWICKLFLSSEEERKNLLSLPLVASWFEVLAKDDFADLKEYLNRKYKFIGSEDDKTKEKLRFLEDFILFNNPARESWEKTSENIKTMNIRKGDKIIDFGCGPGYFTFKFANIVGSEGYVYGIETNYRHINFVKDYINKNEINNVDVFKYQIGRLGLDSSTKVDIAFTCSLYHILYAAFTQLERDLLMENIKRSLKEDGRFIVVDNDLVEKEKLPYFGPYISRQLIISQLYHYGFDLVAQYQFTPQRYVLEFKVSPTPYKVTDPSIPTPAMFIDEKSNIIRVTSRQPLIQYPHVGTSRGYTLFGKKAARLLYAAIEKKDKATVETALGAYEKLIPTELIGDEYSAFEWLCNYLLASKEQQAKLLENKFDAEFFNYLADDDFAPLKKYIRIKYDLANPDPEINYDDEIAVKNIHDTVYEYEGKEMTPDQITDFNKFLSCNDPNREKWEVTSKMLNYINIQEGETVADIGGGPGYFSFIFSQLVGTKGKVYCTETSKEALEHVERINNKLGLNIQTIMSKLNDASLPRNSIDTVFMCSVYHDIYMSSIEFVKDQFIASIKKALKKGGRLVVVDNPVTPPTVVGYFGPQITKELIITQLRYYGFQLIGFNQFSPHRYVLIFEKD